MPFVIPTSTTLLSSPTPSPTTMPPSVILALRVTTGVFAVIVFGFLALITGWSMYRNRVARRQEDTESGEAKEKVASVSEEPEVDMSDYEILMEAIACKKAANMKEDEESIVGIPELAYLAKILNTTRMADYTRKGLSGMSHALQVTPSLASIEVSKKSPAKVPAKAPASPDTTSPLKEVTSLRPSAAKTPARPLTSKNGNIAETAPWTRYVPRHPSPLGPGVRRGSGSPHGTPWRQWVPPSNKENFGRSVMKRKLSTHRRN